MVRINRSGAATRTRILEAATAILAKEGIAGFTLQAVAKSADIRYGNLTHHYPTREILIEGMFDFLVERYNARFQAMTAQFTAGSASIRDIVAWLLDDSVTRGTAPVFLQLWAMACSMPDVARGMARLYDQAVSAFMEACGVEPDAPHSKGLRDALFLLGTVIEGSSAIFWTRDPSGRDYANTVRDLAVETLTDMIEARLAEARAALR